MFDTDEPVKEPRPNPFIRRVKRAVKEQQLKTAIDVLENVSEVFSTDMLNLP